MMVSNCDNAGDSTLHGVTWNGAAWTTDPLIPVHDTDGNLFQLCERCARIDGMTKITADTTITRVVTFVEDDEIVSSYAGPISVVLPTLLPSADGWEYSVIWRSYETDVKVSFEGKLFLSYKLTQGLGI